MSSKSQTTSLVHEYSPAITVEVSRQVQGVEYQSLSLKTPPDPWRKCKPSRMAGQPALGKYYLISGSIGSGGLTIGDEGPLFWCSNDDLPPEVSEQFKEVTMSIESYRFAGQAKSQVYWLVWWEYLFVEHPLWCLGDRQKFLRENEDL